MYNHTITTLSVRRNLSLLQSDTHYNPKHQNEFYLDTDKLYYSLKYTPEKTKVSFSLKGEKTNAICNCKRSFLKNLRNCSLQNQRMT